MIDTWVWPALWHPFTKTTSSAIKSQDITSSLQVMHVKWDFGNIREKIHCKVQIHDSQNSMFQYWSLAMENALFSPIVYTMWQDKGHLNPATPVCQTTYPICSMGTTKLFSSTTCSTRYLYKISFTIPNVIALVSVWSDVLRQVHVLHCVCIMYHVGQHVAWYSLLYFWGRF